MTLVLAVFLGLYFIGAGLALLLSPNQIIRFYKQLMKDEGLLFLTAFIALVFGSAIISLHNRWIMHWPVFITIIGWAAFIKGILLMAYPESASRFKFLIDQSETFYRIYGAAAVLLGLLLAYQGW